VEARIERYEREQTHRHTKSTWPCSPARSPRLSPRLSQPPASRSSCRGGPSPPHPSPRAPSEKPKLPLRALPLPAPPTLRARVLVRAPLLPTLPAAPAGIFLTSEAGSRSNSYYLPFVLLLPAFFTPTSWSKKGNEFWQVQFPLTHRAWGRRRPLVASLPPFPSLIKLINLISGGRLLSGRLVGIPARNVARGIAQRHIASVFLQFAHIQTVPTVLRPLRAGVPRASLSSSAPLAMAVTALDETSHRLDSYSTVTVLRPFRAGVPRASLSSSAPLAMAVTALDEMSATGAFVRTPSSFRNTITADGSSGFRRGQPVRSGDTGGAHLRPCWCTRGALGLHVGILYWGRTEGGQPVRPRHAGGSMLVRQAGTPG